MLTKLILKYYNWKYAKLFVMSRYNVIGIVPVKDLLDYTMAYVKYTNSGKCVRNKEYFGKTINIATNSLKVVKASDLRCGTCGLKIKFAAIHKKPQKIKAGEYQATCFGVRRGIPIEFNRDHIIPRAVGGKNVQNNLKVMCKECNTVKGARLIPEDILAMCRQGVGRIELSDCFLEVKIIKK